MLCHKVRRVLFTVDTDVSISSSKLEFHVLVAADDDYYDDYHYYYHFHLYNVLFDAWALNDLIYLYL